MTNITRLQCVICNKDSEDTAVLKNGRAFYHCKVCNFTGLDSKLFLNPDEEKSRYDYHENSIENKGYVSMFEKFIDFAVKPYKVKAILDYGSGPGPVLAELLSRLDYEVSIYDPFYAQNDFDKESFDLVTSTEVFEHFNNPVQELKKLLHLVKPEGYIAIMTRFRPEIENFKAWFYKDDDTHVSFYTPETFDYLAKKFNLKIIKHDDFQTIVLQKSS